MMTNVSLVNEYLARSGLIVRAGKHCVPGVRSVLDQEFGYAGGEIHVIGASWGSDWILRELSSRFRAAGIDAIFDVDEIGVMSVLVFPDRELSTKLESVSSKFGL